MSGSKFLGWLAILIFSCTAAWAGPAFTDIQDEQGIARISLGEIELIAFEDSPAGMDIGLFSGPLTPEERESLLPEGYAPASVNVFAVIAAEQTVLIDSGNGQNATPAGKLLKQLSHAGIAAGQVDIALLTHLHFDHISGLLADKEGALPKAGIYISSPELRFWAAPELTRDERLGRNAGLVSKVLHAYGGRIMTFEYGGRVTPNITAVKADGHTPGHTAFLLESAGERLLIIGDLLHGALLQFPHPDENTAYDMSQADARATRRRILSWVSEENIPVAGMHIPWPGIGYVQKAGDGFVFKPLQ